MKKYYIGLIILLVLTLGLTGYVVSQALIGKQDVATEKKAQEIATSLNSYIARSYMIPDSLSEAKIKDVPSTIKYEKLSEEEYKFCVTYKTSKSYGYGGGSYGFYGLLTPFTAGEGVSDYSSSYDKSSSYLYISYSHKKGENCQTIKPYIYSSYSNKQKSTTTKPKNSTNSVVNDTERQTDINAIYSQLEAYYAENAEYPQLTDLNDSAWRATNMNGLSRESLKDPSGSSYSLTSIPTKKAYSYSAKADDGGSCNDSYPCAYYTLTAYKEDGSTIVKYSLN